MAKPMPAVEPVTRVSLFSRCNSMSERFHITAVHAEVDAVDVAGARTCKEHDRVVN